MIFIRVIVEKTVIVETVTRRHQGQNALITKKLCESSQSAKSNPAPYTTCATRKNHLGKATNPKPATATAITTGSVIRPINGLGKPRSVDCQAFATFPQETTALISQANFEFGLPASFQASIERTKDAIRLKVELINIAI